MNQPESNLLTGLVGVGQGQEVPIESLLTSFQQNRPAGLQALDDFATHYPTTRHSPEETLKSFHWSCGWLLSMTFPR